MMSSLSENLDRLEQSIAAACRKAGRPRGEVELMAVSKTYPASTILEAASLGLHLFGENRVQEFAAKAPDLNTIRLGDQSAAQGLTSPAEIARTVGQGFSPDNINANFTRALAPEVNPSSIKIHLIGHLQSNKATRAAELFDAVDSVDSLRLAERLNEASTRRTKNLPILIEVKLSPEETKAGLDPNSPEAAALLERLPNLTNLQLQGLMTIAPWGVAEDITRACFRTLRQLRDQWSAAHPRLSLAVLSMGMSGDFPLAIEEGATRIRVGTALFGKRQPWTGAE
jgi:pyridoxal phosphate enzyme (YggS family)